MLARRAAIVAAVCCALGNSAAQEPPPFRAQGQVRSSSGAPIAGATVWTDAARAHTDSAGRFILLLAITDSTTVTVRRLGFAQVSFTLPTDSLALLNVDVELEPVALALQKVDVRDQRVARIPSIDRFNERRREKAGVGHFLTREDIVRREGMPLSSLLAQARGVTIVRSRNGRGVLRFTRWTQRGRSCAPMVWLDGISVKGFEIDDMPSSDVEALELYATAASAPPEFDIGSELACGVVVIWTRRPILRSR